MVMKTPQSPDHRSTFRLLSASLSLRSAAASAVLLVSLREKKGKKTRIEISNCSGECCCVFPFKPQCEAEAQKAAGGSAVCALQPSLGTEKSSIFTRGLRGG